MNAKNINGALLVVLFIVGVGLNFGLTRFAPDAHPIFRYGILTLMLLGFFYLNWRQRRG